MHGLFLPHVWVNDSIFINGQADYLAEAIVIHFKDNFLGEDFLKIPEMDSFKNFLKLSKRGMSFHGKTNEQINALMKGMVGMNRIQRLSALLSIFDTFKYQ